MFWKRKGVVIDDDDGLFFFFGLLIKGVGVVG